MASKVNQRNWLKHIRLSKGLTQKEVANKANIARTTYASIEQGERNARVPTAKLSLMFWILNGLFFLMIQYAF
ncbi:helix-turn-helix transcriptional regulator [Bacillus sp. A1(2020)]|uniref:helix-turn-helix transcriptional regulator n=1 Tax=Bacillus sp. A1(2020) TaxID=2789210 RepID=UPI00325B874C